MHVRRRAILATLVLALPALTPAAGPRLPARPDSVKFAVIGDSGTGDREQYELGRRMAAARAAFPYDFVIMLGDNIYGRDRPQDFFKKFEQPYRPIVDAGVPFYAALGNHDNPKTQAAYKLFNMDGRRYYTFSKGPVQFFVLDTTLMNEPQLRWLESELAASVARWKIAYMHHPLYSNGKRHGGNLKLRAFVEPLFREYGVDVAFAGHEHFYERISPQYGVYYFTCGSAAKLRDGNIRHSPSTLAGFDTDLSFMLVEIVDDTLHFEVISRLGDTVDQGVLPRPEDLRPLTESRAPAAAPGAP